MHWSVVPFGKYRGKTFPEIIVRDLDWFFWVAPKLYGKLADEGKSLRGRHGPSKFQFRVGSIWRSNIHTKAVTGSAALRSASSPEI
jgi:hypothetical protein